MQYQTKEEQDAAAARAVQWMMECGKSFVRFLDFVYVSDPILGTVKFELWPKLLELAKAFASNRLLVVLKARQVGVSWLVACFALWVAMYHAQSNVLMLSLNEKTAMALLRKCKFVYEHLPPEMHYPVVVNSASQFGFASGGMITALPSTEDAGRSESASLVICDEWEMHEYAETNYGATKPTIDAGGRFIGVSTRSPRGGDTFMLRIYNEAKEGRNNFKALFVGCFARPDRDDEWFEAICREYPERIRRTEYPRTEEEALHPIESSLVFDFPSVQKMKANRVPPIIKSCIYTYRQPDPATRYVCAIDPGEGIGQDSSICVILASHGMYSETVAVIDTNEMRTDAFARECYELCERYYFPNLWFEAGGLGNSVANVLLALKYPRLGYMDDKMKEKGKPGFLMTGASRESTIQDLAHAVKSELVMVHHEKMLNELSVFQYVEIEHEGKTRYRPQAPTGKHDDCVMALAIGVQGLKRKTAAKSGFIPLGGMVQRTLVRT